MYIYAHVLTLYMLCAHDVHTDYLQSATANASMSSAWGNNRSVSGMGRVGAGGATVGGSNSIVGIPSLYPPAPTPNAGNNTNSLVMMIDSIKNRFRNDLDETKSEIKAMTKVMKVEVDKDTSLIHVNNDRLKMQVQELNNNVENMTNGMGRKFRDLKQQIADQVGAERTGKGWGW